MRTVGFAIVGCGAIARKHVASIAACPGARLVAVCDISAERMTETAALWRKESGDCAPVKSFSELRDLLADSAVDVIVIATVSGLHAPMAKQALTAGKHIVLEKPVALSLQDVDDLIQLAAQSGLHAQVCHQLRYRPLLRKMRDLAATGALGQLRGGAVNLRIHRSSGYYQSAKWRGTWEQDGGMLLNQGIHAIDLLLWCLGTPKHVYGQICSTQSAKETEDIAFAVTTFSNDARAVIEANAITLPETLEQSLFLFGDQGAVCVGGAKLERIDRWYVEGQPAAMDEANRLLSDRREHLYMYRAMVDACLGKRVDLISLQEARRALELIFGIYQSAARGNVQSLPLDDFSTSQMKLQLTQNNSPSG